jgi:hypothetical protein
MPTTLTAAEYAQVQMFRMSFPYRIVYVARKEGEESFVSAATSMRIPNKMAREGWSVFTIHNK